MGANDCVLSSAGTHELLARYRHGCAVPVGPGCFGAVRSASTSCGMSSPTTGALSTCRRFGLPCSRYAFAGRGRLVERSEMLQIVWGFGHTGDLKTVDVHVKRLRGRLEPVPSRPRHLLTVRGHGYRLAA